MLDTEKNSAGISSSAVSSKVRLENTMIAEVSSQPAWARWAPGPAPHTRLRCLPPAVKRYGVTSAGCIVMMLSGYNVALFGVVSAQKPYLQIINKTGGTNHQALLIGLVQALHYIGVMVGSAIVGSLSDRLGRRKAITTTGILALCTLALLTSLQNYAWALGARLVFGLNIGAFDSVGLNWSAETASSRRRGLAVGLALSCAAFGACHSYFLSYGLSQVYKNAFSFRFTIGFQVVYMVYIMTAAFILPESPRWLVRVGLHDEARAVLSELNAVDASGPEVHKQAVEDDLAKIQNAIESERKHNAAYSYLAMLFKNDRYKTVRRSWTAIFVQFVCQFMIGAGFVATYGINIFSSSGWDPNLAALLAGFGILIQASAGVPGAMLSDRLGRRRSMWFGGIFGSFLLVMIAMCGYFVNKHAESNPALSKRYSIGVIVILYLWNVHFGMTWLWCAFVYPSEIFVAQSRAKGSSLGIIGLGLGGFTCNMVAPYLFSAIGSNALFFLAGTSFFTGAVCFFLCPETARKTLEDIDTLYD